MSDLTYLELFAGVGGMSLGFDRAGFRCVGHCEIEAFPRRVLMHRWPDVPLFGDVRELRGDQVETPTIVTFGAPCQDLSIAGKRAGLDGDRSSLFHEGIRLWNETNAPYALYENVLGAFSSNRGEDFAAILSAFVGAAVAVPRDGWPKSGVVAGRTGVAAWRVLDAQFFGVPQRRRRVFVLGSRTGALDPAEILAVADRVSGHPQTRRETREGTAADAGAGVEGGSLTPWDAQSKRVYSSAGIFPALAAAEQSGQQQPSVLAINISNVEHTLRTGGAGDSIPVLYEWHNQDSRLRESSVAATLNLNADGREGNLMLHRMLAFGEYADDVPSSAQKARDRGDTDIVVAPTINTTANAKHCGSNQHAQELGQMIQALGRPRRLTPLECERLMGWPDNWTNVPDEKGKPASDSARYKACGNGVATPVAHWIALQLRKAIEGVSA